MSLYTNIYCKNMVFPNFTIIIPIFNQKKNIIKLLKNIILKVKKSNFEIIIVDDSSTDGSQEKIKSFIKKKKFIKLISRKKFPRDLLLKRQIDSTKPDLAYS